MGFPFSKETEAAVAAVKNIKNAFILLAAVRIMKAVTLAVFLPLVLLAILSLLITVNPDLEHERATIVTPAVRGIIHILSTLVSVIRLQKDMKRLKAEGLQERVE